MREYIYNVPWFIFFVLLGVVVNYLFFKEKKGLTTILVAREFVGAIWASIIIFAVFDQFFDFKILFVYAICSLTGFLNSMLINFLKKDLFEFLVMQGKQAVKNLVENLKRGERNRRGGWGGHYRDDEDGEEIEDKPL